MTGGPPTELWRLDATALAFAIRAKQCSAREAVASALGRLEAVNPTVNAVSLPLAEEALAAADAADRAIARGDSLGALHGVTVTTKENVDQAGCPTTNGVPAFREVIAAEDSPPVASLRAAGAIIIGRTNTPALSLRWHTDNAAAGRTLNPWNAGITPGGSSGGAAAALASGIGALAQGSDLGGSVRYPAYCCGVAGLRPTLGRMAAFNGTAAVERSPTGQLMAVQGVLARRVADLGLGLRAMSREDRRDPWWVPVPLELPPPPPPIRVALAPRPRGMEVHPVVAAAVERAGKALADAGYEVDLVEPPGLDLVFEIWANLVSADIRATFLATIERVGDPDAKRSMAFWMALFPPIDLDRYIALLAERVRHLRAWGLFLERYPILVTPVSGQPPFAVGFDIESSAATGRVMNAQTVLAAVNCLGLPAVAVPVGHDRGVPLGVQLIAGRFREDLALGAAAVIEARHPTAAPIDPRP